MDEKHECTFPWTGALQQCLTCGVWHQVVEFSDPEQGTTWKTWMPVPL